MTPATANPARQEAAKRHSRPGHGMLGRMERSHATLGTERSHATLGTERTDTAFSSGGVACAAWLYRPAGPGPHPGVVLAHAFGGVREMGLDHYARRFAAAGVAVLAFDYRHFGGSGGQPRHLWSVRRLRADVEAALAFLGAVPFVDPARLALWGSSFGGGLALQVAAKHPELAAVVVQCPFVDGAAAALRAPLRSVLRRAPAALYDAARGLAGVEPYRIKIVGEPGELAVLDTPDAETYLRLVPAGVAWPNEVAARSVVPLVAHRPVTAARRVRSPLLVCVCDRDLACPPDLAEKVAREAPRAEAVHYPVGHFDVYLGEAFERAVAGQCEFLARHLAPGRLAAGRP